MHPASKYLRICIYATIVQTSWIAYSCVHKSRWKHTQTQIESNANPDKSQQKCNVLCIQLPSIYEYVSMQPLCRLRELHIHVCTNLDENILKLKSRAMQTPTNLSKSVMFCASSFQVFTNACYATIVQTSWICIFMCAQISMKTCSNQNRAMQTPTNLSKSAVFCASSCQVLETMYQEQRSCRHRDFAYSCVHKCRWKHAQIKIDSNANPDKSQQKCSVLCIELTSIGNNVSRATIMQTSWFCIFMCAQMSMKTCSNQNRNLVYFFFIVLYLFIFY